MNGVTQVLLFLLRGILAKKAAVNLKNKGILLYLKTLQVARKSIIGMIFVFIMLQLMFLSFLGSVVSGIWLLPYDLDIKIWILFYTFLTLFTIPFVILLYALSDKAWFKASGVEKLIQD